MVDAIATYTATSHRGFGNHSPRSFYSGFGGMYCVKSHNCRGFGAVAA